MNAIYFFLRTGVRAISRWVPICLCGVVLVRPATAQGTVTGEVRDAQGKPLEFAGILLLKAEDSTLVKGAASDAGGRYTLATTAYGSFRVAASLVGFQKVYSEPFSLTTETPGRLLPALILRQDAGMLGEVKVTARKPFIEQQADKTVLNVENSLVSSGGTALEVLEKAPGVLVDTQNERISLKGREGVLVMIDGKPTYLSTAEVMNLLRNTPSNSIETIELITNPSARYDAAGTSGIINIRLKRNNKVGDGLNGNATLGLGNGRYPKYNSGLTLNARQGNWGLFGNYNFDHRENYSGIDIDRFFNDNGRQTVIEQYGYRPGSSNGHTFKAGADYFLGKRTTVGLMVNGLLVDGKARINNDNRLFDGDHVLQTIQTMTNATRRGTRRIASNLNVKHTFDTARGPGRELTVDLDYSTVVVRPQDNLLTRTFSAENVETVSALYQRTDSPSDVTIRAAKADYVHPIRKKGQIEAGWKTSYVTSDNDVRFETQREGGWQIDPGRTNHFIYQETIHAAYLNGRREWKKWSVQAGLRLEATRSVGNSVTLSNIVDRAYTDLFPSVFLSRKISEKHQLSTSYSRRIDRPNYQTLNPFVYVMDPYAYFQGNPYLQPQYTHAFQASYTYKGESTISLGYNRTLNVITDMSEQDDRTRVTKLTLTNLDVLTNLSLSLSFPLPVTRWWKTRQSVTVYRNAYDAVYLGQRLDNRRTSANASTNHSFVLPRGFTAELSATYNSPFVYGLNKLRSHGQVSVGVQKSLWNKKANLRLNVSDLFLTQRMRGAINYQNLNLRFLGFSETRIVRLTFTYAFGNRTIKGGGNRRSATDDEQRRAGQ